ncbi:MAG: hypothetical protein ACLGG5_03655 [Thermoleophilia bacterium]
MEVEFPAPGWGKLAVGEELHRGWLRKPARLARSIRRAVGKVTGSNAPLQCGHLRATPIALLRRVTK